MLAGFMFSIETLPRDSLASDSHYLSVAERTSSAMRLSETHTTTDTDVPWSLVYTMLIDVYASL